MLKSIKVKDYMTTKLVTFSADMSVHKAIKLLLEYRISGAPVVGSDGALLGLLSEQDCLKSAVSAVYNDVEIGMVSNFMSTEVESITSEQSILDAASMFIDNRRRRLPVVDNGKLIGQISRRDILRAVDDFANS